MRDLIARVARTIRQECLIGAGTDGDGRIAVAVSGGPDSVALTWILHALAPDIGLTLAGLIHVNHQLRAGESDRDEAFCRDLAARLDLPIEVTSVDVAARARERRQSNEVAARDARYAFFDTAAAHLHATVVATGHTLDDQAETVLLRLLRGAGTRGLSGIRVRRGRYVRPLLHCRRADLRSYLETRGEAWRDDASNADVAILRNRIRHELMPIVARIAPAGATALARLAALAHDDETFLTQAAIKNRSTLVLSEEGTGGPVRIDALALSLLPPALGRRLVRALAAELAPAATLSARHLGAVSRLAATDKSSGHLDLPGLTVEKRGDALTLSRTSAVQAIRVPPVGSAVWSSRTLEVPGFVVLREAGVTIEVRVGTGVAGEWTQLGPVGAAIQAGSVRLPLAVRNRRPGDRFRPLGAPGRRKLQDLFVDRKVPRSERDRVAVVVDADDKIVWVAGLAVADDCRVTAPEDGVLILEQRTTE